MGFMAAEAGVFQAPSPASFLGRARFWATGWRSWGAGVQPPWQPGALWWGFMERTLRCFSMSPSQEATISRAGKTPPGGSHNSLSLPTPCKAIPHCLKSNSCNNHEHSKSDPFQPAPSEALLVDIAHICPACLVYSKLLGIGWKRRGERLS